MSGASKVELKALELLALHAGERVPVPVEEIAERLGAEIAYDTLEEQVSGILIRESDRRAIIGVNSAHAHVRQRFTIAHEIGHLVMHPGQPVFVDRVVRVDRRDGSHGRQETEANAFAASLLMPREAVLARADAITAAEQNVTPEALARALASQFDVSAPAMGFRLTNLNVVDPHTAD